MARIQIFLNNKNILTFFFPQREKKYIRYLQNVIESQLQWSLVHLITITLMFYFQVVFQGWFENMFLSILLHNSVGQRADNKKVVQNKTHSSHVLNEYQCICTELFRVNF